MRHFAHPWSSDGEICKSWGELEAVCGTALDEDWGLLERVWSTWETIGQGFPQRLNNLASALVLTAEVVLSPSHPCRRDHPRWEIFLIFCGLKGIDVTSAPCAGRFWRRTGVPSTASWLDQCASQSRPGGSLYYHVMMIIVVMIIIVVMMIIVVMIIMWWW